MKNLEGWPPVRPCRWDSFRYFWNSASGTTRATGRFPLPCAFALASASAAISCAIALRQRQGCPLGLYQSREPSVEQTQTRLRGCGQRRRSATAIGNDRQRPSATIGKSHRQEPSATIGNGHRQRSARAIGSDLAAHRVEAARTPPFAALHLCTLAPT